MAGRKPIVDLDQMLDAAECVVLEMGIGSLTLDAVAQRAGVSKGGLLHHYPTKDGLIQAMVDRVLLRHQRDVESAIDAAPEGPGRVTRGLLHLCTAHPDAFGEACRRSSQVVLAALANNPTLVEPMRAWYRKLFAKIEGDGLVPGHGEVVALAIDGLWFGWTFGLDPLGRERLHTVLRVLGGLADKARSCGSEAVAAVGERVGASDTPHCHPEG